ncbi:MAG: hypothetical protein KF744_05650 [Taibaiella sp.]|nr:hypothetical protein [Taibaiella sp.]
MKKWLFNPFMYIAGGKALGLGILVMSLSSVAAYLTTTHFDGVLHMSPYGASPLWIFIAEQAICWLSVTTVLQAGAMLFSQSRIRVIDVAGTQALARWPAILIALLGPAVKAPKGLTPESIAEAFTPLTIISLLLTLTFVVWMVALFYNAFKVSANIKGGKGVAVFIVGLLLADLFSRLILSQLYKIA